MNKLHGLNSIYISFVEIFFNFSKFVKINIYFSQFFSQFCKWFLLLQVKYCC